MNKCLVVVECAIEAQGKYLIIKKPSENHGKTLLAFPGGKVEEQDIQGDILLSSGKYHFIKRPAQSHGEGLLDFPGEKAEKQNNQDDALISAVKRKVLEEVDITLEDPIHYITSRCFIDRFGNPVMDAIFHCLLEKSSATVTASEREVPAYYWMTKDEIMAADNSPEWLKHYINQI